MPPPTRNAELLRKVADAIEANPDHYYQGSWCENDNTEEVDYTDVPFVADPKNHCGTQACVAGWAVQLTPPENRPDEIDIADAAQTLLGLTDDEAEMLFSGGCDPNIGMPALLRALANGSDLEAVLDDDDD